MAAKFFELKASRLIFSMIFGLIFISFQNCGPGLRSNSEQIFEADFNNELEIIDETQIRGENTDSTFYTSDPVAEMDTGASLANNLALGASSSSLGLLDSASLGDPSSVHFVEFKGNFRTERADGTEVHGGRVGVVNYTSVEQSTPQLHRTPGRFAPLHDIIITKVLVQTDKLPVAKYGGRLTGDVCFFIRSPEDPRAAVIHCTSTVTAGKDGFSRVVDYPDDIGVFLPAGSSFGCAVHLSVPKAIGRDLSQLDAERAQVRCKVEFRLAPSSGSVGKILRIPYLDSFLEGRTLIRPHPLYKAFDESALIVRGWSTYAGPNGGVDNFYEDICLMATSGNRVTRKVCGPNIGYRAAASFLSGEGFVDKRLVVKQGETLRGSCNSRTPKRLDCALFVLVEIPSSKRTRGGGGAFHDPGVVNLNYLKNSYCTKILDFSEVTQAGERLLDDLRASDTPPWSVINDSLTGNLESQRREMCKSMFVPR